MSSSGHVSGKRHPTTRKCNAFLKPVNTWGRCWHLPTLLVGLPVLGLRGLDNKAFGMGERRQMFSVGYNSDQAPCNGS